jgi:hypothetical protein
LTKWSMWLPLALLCAGLLSIVGMGIAFGDDATTPEVELVTGNWKCNSPQDGTVVIIKRATQQDGVSPADAVHLGDGCTGRIASIIIEQATGDGIKIGEGAHDLTVESGYIHCVPKTGIKHQDGIQAQGGLHVHIENMKVDCPTGNNGGFFTSQGLNATTPPTDVICDNCDLFEGNAALHVGDSTDSGAVNSTLRVGTSRVSPADCTRIEPFAIDPIDQNNICVP